MGDFTVTFTLVGGHGCDRKAREGDDLAPMCANPSCPDCYFRGVAAEVKSRGMIPKPFGGQAQDRYGAKLHHWPSDADGGIVDDLAAGKRIKGSFIK